MSRHSPDTRKCPVCGKAQAELFKPFCSKRCADVDLSRWLKGSYAIPVEDIADLDPEATDDKTDTG